MRVLFYTAAAMAALLAERVASVALPKQDDYRYDSGSLALS